MDMLLMTAAALARGVVQGIGRAAVSAVGAGLDLTRERAARTRKGVDYSWPDPETYRDADYSFKEKWKEELIYTEPGGTYSFNCGWGDFTRPFSVGVPTAEYWDRAMPDFMRGRRDEILGRLRGWAGNNYNFDEYEPEHLRPAPE
jgi:hypothetical protein